LKSRTSTLGASRARERRIEPARVLVVEQEANAHAALAACHSASNSRLPVVSACQM
jgi:hypothetical protein